MKKLSVYSIPYIGLKEGDHVFHYTIDRSFFEQHENSIVSDGKVNIELTLSKRVDFILLHFQINGTVVSACDRCLENFDHQIEGVHEIYVKFDENLVEQSEFESDIMYISRTDTHLNVAQLIYEFIILSIPIRKVHPDNMQGNPTCNEAVLQRLQIDKAMETDQKMVDPRWAALKNLKNE